MTVDPTQPLAESQIEGETDALVHARFVSLCPAEVPSFDMRTESIVIGRDPDACQILVKDKRVSARHVRIYRDKFAYYVEALGSGPTWHQGHMLKKGEVRALSSGDSVSLLYNANAKVDAAKSVKHVADFLFQALGRREKHGSPDDIESHYQITADLGAGNFSKVMVGIDKKDARVKVAIKKICVDMFEKFRKRRGTKLTLKSEVDAMKGLRHVNIVQLIQTFESADSLYLVMELCEGGDLLHNILDAGPFRELSGRRLFREILFGVKYLHDRNIVHRDFKPENILLTSASRETMVAKISDFGLAVQLGGGLDNADVVGQAQALQEATKTLQKLKATATMCRTFCGTPHYFAPEMILSYRKSPGAASTYGKEVDMWSVGVILYVILSAVPPFDQDDADLEALYVRITAGEWDFDVEEFDAVSPESKDLVRSLMKNDPKTRLTVEQALGHRWLAAAPACASSSAAVRSAEAAGCGPPEPAKRAKTLEVHQDEHEPGRATLMRPPAAPPAAPGEKETPGEESMHDMNRLGC